MKLLPVKTVGIVTENFQLIWFYCTALLTTLGNGNGTVSPNFSLPHLNTIFMLSTQNTTYNCAGLYREFIFLKLSSSNEFYAPHAVSKVIENHLQSLWEKAVPSDQNYFTLLNVMTQLMGAFLSIDSV